MSKNHECAACAICCLKMEPKNGCTLTYLIINGKRHARVRVGDSLDCIPCTDENPFCHDCNVGLNQYHHLGCDSERCPVCYDQLFLCDCDKQPSVPLSPICNVEDE